MTLEATRARGGMRAEGRWMRSGLAALLGVLCAVTNLPPAHAAPAMFSLTGNVCDRATGRPIPAATVAIGSREVQANNAGIYRIQVPAASHYFTQASAPGHQSTGFIIISNPSGGLLVGDASFSFCGGLGLMGAFRSVDGGVRIAPFDLVRATNAPLVISGRSSELLEDAAALQRPDGGVDLIGIQRHGTGFRLPLHFGAGAGRYMLEINAGAGFALLKIPICIGRYQPPAPPPNYRADRSGASPEQLQAAALLQINTQRAAAHLASLESDARLTREAQAHSQDIVANNYVMQHAHVGANGSTPSDRIHAAGINFRAMAEDIGTGSSLQEIVVDLMDSPAHRWAILGDFVHAGVGVARQGGTLTLTVDFVR
jgi:cysteine-rich secretory family protein